LVAFDITFRDPETQEELQPITWTVQVKFNYEENESLVQAEEKEGQEVKVYHLNDIDEEWNKIEELTWTTVEEVAVNEEESKDNKIVINTNGFSIYVINNISVKW
jgi:fibronectin type 3 domain-containing protein